MLAVILVIVIGTIRVVGSGDALHRWAATTERSEEFGKLPGVHKPRLRRLCAIRFSRSTLNRGFCGNDTLQLQPARSSSNQPIPSRLKSMREVR